MIREQQVAIDEQRGMPGAAAVMEALRAVMDPDLHRSIVDLGFVKNLKIEDGRVAFDLELTTPACPVKDKLRDACRDVVMALPGVREVQVNMTARIRPPAQRLVMPTVKNLVAVASGKGGVGKSTMAVNLAAALRASGAAVGLLDADIYGPSIPTMVRITKPPQTTPQQRLIPAEGAGMKVVSMGLFVAPDQAAVLRGPMVSKYVSQFLGAVDWGELDYLVVDYPPGTGDVQLTLSQQAPITGAVIVTTPQDLALADVRRGIAMFEKTGVPILGVCEVMSYFVCDGCGKRHYIFRSGGGELTARRAGVPFLGAVPLDPVVVVDSDSGVPVVDAHPDSPASAAYRAVAGAVAAQLSTLALERGNYLESFRLEWKS